MVTHNDTAMFERPSPPDAVERYDMATLSTLTPAQLIAVAPLVTGERPTIALRDCLLHQLRLMLHPDEPLGSSEADARLLAVELRTTKITGPHSELLATIGRLGRARRPPDERRIASALRRISSRT